MLCELKIINLALIDKLHIEFDKAFNVLTGETGAGKSIIVNALNLALGERATVEDIRTGAAVSSIEALFDLSENDSIRTKINSLGIDIGDEKTILIRREISRSGRSKCYLNGNIITLSMLKEIGEQLIDMHGQHEHQSLFYPNQHREFLDSYGNLQKLREKVKILYENFSSLSEEKEKLTLSEQERQKQLDYLSFQIEEINQAQLQAGEEESLLKEKTLLTNAEKLATLTSSAYHQIYESEQSITSQISTIVRIISELANLDETFAPLEKSCQSLDYQLEEIAFTLRDYRERINFEPQRLEEVEERLALLQKLKRKYAPTTEEIIMLHQKLLQERMKLERAEEKMTEINEKLGSLNKDLVNNAERLSGKRKVTAKELRKLVENELHQLGMPHARIKIEVDNSPPPLEKQSCITPHGIDHVEILISPNVGEDLKPLRKIASGGEISRVMLSLKTILAAVDQIPTLIFDEIDANIGGKLGEVVGKKLSALSSSYQVICITHLPQIARFASTHFQVKKELVAGRTITKVEKLTGQKRVKEIAAMLGGKELTPIAHQHAAELLGQVEKGKKDCERRDNRQ